MGPDGHLPPPVPLEGGGGQEQQLLGRTATQRASAARTEFKIWNFEILGAWLQREISSRSRPANDFQIRKQSSRRDPDGLPFGDDDGDGIAGLEIRE